MLHNQLSLSCLAELTGFQDLQLLRTGLMGALIGVLPENINCRYYYSGLRDEDGAHWQLREVYSLHGDGVYCPYMNLLKGDGDIPLADFERLNHLAGYQEYKPLLRVDSQGLSMAVCHRGILTVILIDGEGLDQYQMVLESLLVIYSNMSSLLERSSVDSLTGLYNRRTFEEKVNPLFCEQDSPHRRKDEQASEHHDFLMIFDIDHFKQINDRFGHLYGDEVLVLMGRIMRETFRDQDWLFRIGGEEFVVVARHVSEDDVNKVFDRFRQVVANFDFPQVGKVTISLGYTQIDRSHSLPDIVGRADEALYYAKGHGRNRVDYYEGLLAAGHLHEAAVSGGGIDLF